MSDAMTLLGIAGAIAVAAVSPGPTLLMVARTAVARTRADGLAAALGIAIAGVIYALTALAGLKALLVAAPVVSMVIKAAGGLYLVYLGMRLVAGASAELQFEREPAASAGTHRRRAILLGLGTHLSNPKTVVVYAGVFTAFMPSHVSGVLVLWVITAVFLVEFGWYAIVAWALATGPSRRAYTLLKPFIDRAAGITLIGVGAELCWSAWRHG